MRRKIETTSWRGSDCAQTVTVYKQGVRKATDGHAPYRPDTKQELWGVQQGRSFAAFKQRLKAVFFEVEYAKKHGARAPKAFSWGPVPTIYVL